MPIDAASSPACSVDHHDGGQRLSRTALTSGCSKNLAAAFSSGNSQAAATWKRLVTPPSPPISKWIGPASNVPPKPADAPRPALATRTTLTLPSDFFVTASVNLPPTSTNITSTVPSQPVVLVVSGQGASPARRASPLVQMSPPTRQRPWRSVSATPPARLGAPTAGAATSNTAATRATAAMYSSV